MRKLSLLVIVNLMSQPYVYATDTGINSSNVFFPLASTAMGGLTLATSKEGAPGIPIGAGLIGSGAVLSLILHFFGSGGQSKTAEFDRMRTEFLAFERTGESSAELADYLSRVRLEVPEVTAVNDKELVESLIVAQAHAATVSGVSVK